MVYLDRKENLINLNFVNFTRKKNKSLKTRT